MLIEASCILVQTLGGKREALRRHMCAMPRGLFIDMRCVGRFYKLSWLYR